MGLTLEEWARQFLTLKTRMHGWTLREDEQGILLEKKQGATRVIITETLPTDIPDGTLVITLNTRENEEVLISLLPKLSNTRFILVNPRQNAYWSVNTRYHHTFGKDLLTNLTTLRGDVDYVS